MARIRPRANIAFNVSQYCQTTHPPHTNMSTNNNKGFNIRTNFIHFLRTPRHILFHNSRTWDTQKWKSGLVPYIIHKSNALYNVLRLSRIAFRVIYKGCRSKVPNLYWISHGVVRVSENFHIRLLTLSYGALVNFIVLNIILFEIIVMLNFMWK